MLAPHPDNHKVGKQRKWLIFNHFLIFKQNCYCVFGGYFLLKTRHIRFYGESNGEYRSHEKG